MAVGYLGLTFCFFFRTLVGGQVRVRVPQDHDRPARHEEGQGHVQAAQGKAGWAEQSMGKI